MLEELVSLLKKKKKNGQCKELFDEKMHEEKNEVSSFMILYLNLHEVVKIMRFCGYDTICQG